MANIVCQVISRDDSITFIWAEGGGSFDPYKIDGQALLTFRAAAKTARARLSDLVKDYLNGTDEDVRKSSLELARAGAKLSSLIFRPDSGSAGRVGKLVRKWLDEMTEQNAVDTLEIVIDGPSSIPWNVIYGKEPDQVAFLSGEDTAHWGQFWGIKYNLAANRRVEPLRRLPLIRDPKVLLVIDPSIRDGLPDDQRARLLALAAKHHLPMVTSRDDLIEALRHKRPDLIYWLCHADPTALILADEPISPNDLLEMLRSDDDEDRIGGIAFLNACQTAESTDDGCFLDALQEVGLSGIIATEQQTIDTFANPLGLDFLEAFLERGEEIGTVMQGLRGRVPLGLLYGTYCPPNIRVAGLIPEPMALPNRSISALARMPGVALGMQSGEAAPVDLDRPKSPYWAGPDLPLPESPYRSLAFFERSERALFGGRDADIIRFARLLDDSKTRMVILHGESGVGKSSFLRAGAIPYLEEECIGYRFFRCRTGEGIRSPVLFIRATNDLPTQLASAIVEFCKLPIKYQTPTGDPVEVDLPALLRTYIGESIEPSTLKAAMTVDPSLLGRFLSDVADALPFAPVLVIDQGEEVFTLVEGLGSVGVRNNSLELLRRAASMAGDFKVIVSLRTEYYGRLIDRLRKGGRDQGGIREYLLTDFNETDVVEAIRRPTLNTTIPHALEIPFEKYKFRFADGVPERIAQAVMTVGTQRRDSPLPLVQVICVQLYELARKRPDAIVTDADFALIGGVAGGLRRHVETQIGEMLKSNPADIPRVKSLFVNLFLTQPDGSLTTALVPEDELAQLWKGSTPFPDILKASMDRQLIRVNSLRIGDSGERRYVSLGHDALAKVAADWERELRQRRRVRVFRVSLITAIAGLVIMGLFAVHFANEARLQAIEARINLYKVQLNAAEQAWDNGEIERLRSTLLSVRPRKGHDDYRGFEWSYLWRLAQPGELPEALLPTESRCVDATSNGTRLAIGRSNGHVELWNPRTKQQLDSYVASTEPLSAIAISQDGKLIATPDAARGLRLWDVERRQFRMTLVGPLERVVSLRFSTDGKWLASGDKIGHVCLWNVATGQVRTAPPFRRAWILALAFSHDGNDLAYGVDNMIHLWHLDTNKQQPMQGHKSVVTSIAFAKRGQVLASGHRNGDVLVWNLFHDRTVLPRLRQMFSGHKGQVTSLSFARGNKILASGSRDSTVKTWSVEQGQHFATLKGHSGTFLYTNFLDEDSTNPDFDPESGTATILTVSDGETDQSHGQLRIWSLPNPQQSLPLRGHHAQVWDFAFDERRDQIISGGNDSVVHIWNLDTGKTLHKLNMFNRSVETVAISPDGQTLAVGVRGGSIFFWNLEDREFKAPFRTLPTGQKSVWRIRFLGDNNHLVVSGTDGSVRLWDLALPNNQTPELLANHLDIVFAPGIATWKDTVASCGEDGMTYVWNRRRGLRTFARENNRTALYPATFSPDGRTLATGDIRGNIVLWDVETGKLLADIPAHVGAVEALAYTSDGHRIASGGADSTVKIWSTRTNRQLLTLRDHHDAITSIGFIRKDKTLASSSEDGTIKLWRAASDEELIGTGPIP